MSYMPVEGIPIIRTSIEETEHSDEDWKNSMLFLTAIGISILIGLAFHNVHQYTSRQKSNLEECEYKLRQAWSHINKKEKELQRQIEAKKTRVITWTTGREVYGYGGR